MSQEHAEKLFAARPDLYKDPNHKPEMVTAWSGAFEALCGFRPISEIAFFLKGAGAIKLAVGQKRRVSFPPIGRDRRAGRHCGNGRV